MQEKNVTLEIDGMSCGHCVKTVRGALVDSPGVTVVDVEIGSAKIVLDESVTDLDSIAALVDETGFQVVGTSIE